MKILAFTDLHASKKAFDKVKSKAKSAEVIVCAGDFTIFSNGTKKILKAINSLGKPVLLIHGNHEDEKQVERLCKELPNIIYLHKKACTVKFGDKSYLFIGYGGGGFALNDKEQETFTSRFVGKKNIIYVTHAPPYGTKLDMLWEHRGSKSVTGFIKKAKPLLHISGHFHETFYKSDKIGPSLVINPGPEGRLVKV